MLRKFISRIYATELEVVKLGWLPIKKRRDFYLAKASFQALYFDQWPLKLKLELRIPGRTLRLSSETRLTVPSEMTFFEPVLKNF